MHIASGRAVADRDMSECSLQEKILRVPHRKRALRGPYDEDSTSAKSLNDIEGQRRRADVDECGDQADQERVID